MKTKLLFSAALLSGVFAACTNEDIVDGVQNNVSASDVRPSAEVTLNFSKEGESEETRAAFNGSTWSFEDGDVIGALLFDEKRAWNQPQEDPKVWANLTWLQKYNLTDYVHTDYPFSYQGGNADGEATWCTQAKMLEGNYFFTLPREDYNAQRQPVHYLNGQAQDGITGQAALASYSANQYWVGYAQIFEGNHSYETLDVQMARILAPVRFNISNTGTQAYHITKIRIEGAGIASAVTIDPTEAEYNVNGHSFTLNGYNWFNYANYTNNQEDVYGDWNQNLVYNLPEDEEDLYDKNDAVRATVKAISIDGAEEQYAELLINGTLTERTLQPGAKNEAKLVIMLNALTEQQLDDLTLTIFTEEGVVKNINLRQVNEEINVGKGQSAVTDIAIDELTPKKFPVVNVQIDDNSFNATDNFDIKNTDDLLQFISWNANKARTFTATLKNDVEFTQEVVDALATSKATLHIKKQGNSEINLSGNSLDNIILDEFVTINVTGDAVSSVSSNLEKAQIRVAKDATLKLDGFAKGYTNLTVEKGGTLVIDKDITLPSYTNVYGKLSVAKDATLRAAGKLVNYGELDNNGNIWNVVNAKDGKVTTSTGTNHFNENNGTIVLRNITDKTTVVAGAGTIEATLTGKADKATMNANITKLVLAEGASIEMADDKALLAGLKEIVVTGKASIKGYKGGAIASNVDVTVETGNTLTLTDVKLGNITVKKNSAVIVNKGADKVATTVGSLSATKASVDVETGATLVVTGRLGGSNSTLTNRGTVQAAILSGGFEYVGNEVSQYTEPEKPATPTEIEKALAEAGSTSAKALDVFGSLSADYQKMTNEELAKELSSLSVKQIQVNTTAEAKYFNALNDFVEAYNKYLKAKGEYTATNGLLPLKQGAVTKTMLNAIDTAFAAVKAAQEDEE